MYKEGKIGQSQIYKSQENLEEGGSAKALHFNEKVLPSKKNFMLVKDRSPPPQPKQDTPGKGEVQQEEKPEQQEETKQTKQKHGTPSKRAERVVLQFGKTEKENYSLEIKHPLSIIQGFGIALAVFDYSQSS